MDSLAQNAQAKWQAERDAAQRTQEHDEILTGLDRVQRAVLSGHQAQIAAVAAHEGTVTVTNPVTEVRTPDVNKVVDAIQSLTGVTKRNRPENADIVKELRALKPLLKDIPRQIDIPEMPETIEVSNWDEVRPLFEDMALSLRTALERSAAEPKTITVTAPEVVVNEKEVDLSALLASQDKVVAAIAANKVEIPPDDDSAVLAALRGVQETIANLRFPIPNTPTDPLVTYKVADVDDAGAVRYYGNIDARGGWYILKEDTGANPKTYRYASGSGNYAAKWGARASLTYDYMTTLFNG